MQSFQGATCDNIPTLSALRGEVVLNGNTSTKKKILPSTPRILKNNGNQKTSLVSTFRYALCWRVFSLDTVHLWTKHGPRASKNTVMLIDGILGSW